MRRIGFDLLPDYSSGFIKTFDEYASGKVVAGEHF